MLSAVMVVSVSVSCFFSQEDKPREKLLEQQQDDSWQALVKKAFESIYTGFKTLPGELFKYCVVFFCVMYGYTAYNGNKGQFFGIEVYDGNPKVPTFVPPTALRLRTRTTAAFVLLADTQTSSSASWATSTRGRCRGWSSDLAPSGCFRSLSCLCRCS